MGNEGHRILGKTLSTTRVDALEFILRCKINTTFYFGKQEDREQLAWSHVPS